MKSRLIFLLAICLFFEYAVGKVTDAEFQRLKNRVGNLSRKLKCQRAYAQSCTGTINVSATSSKWDYITSPNYPNHYVNNENCEWTIVAGGGYKVIVSIADLDIQCTNDNLIIYDGTAPTVLVNGCDSNTVTTFISTQPSVVVSFTSDASVTKPGFQLKYTAIKDTYTSCSWLPQNHHILIATEKVKYFSSKGYPISYQKQFQEEWFIIKPNASVPLGIRVTDTDMEDNKCRFDAVNIYNDPCPFKEELGEYCASSTPSYTARNSMYVLIRFTSDSTTEGRGTKVQYFLGVADDDVDPSVHIRNILIGVFSSIIIIAVVFGCTRYFIRKCKKGQIRPKPNRNRRFMLESRPTAGTNIPGRPLMEQQQTTTQPRCRLITTLGSSDRLSSMAPVSSDHSANIYSVSGRMTNGRFERNTSGTNIGNNTVPDSPLDIPCPPAYESLYSDPHTHYSAPPPPIDTQPPTHDPAIPEDSLPMSPPPPYTPGITSSTITRTESDKEVSFTLGRSSATNVNNEFKADDQTRS